MQRRTRIASYGILLDATRIMLCRISDQLPQHTGSWTLPGGGIEFGETPEEAMIREVREETGLVVRATSLAGVDSAVVIDNGLETHSIRLLYRADVLGGTPTSEADGTTDLCAWQEITALAALPIVNVVDLGLRLVGRDDAKRTTAERPPPAT